MPTPDAATFTGRPVRGPVVIGLALAAVGVATCAGSGYLFCPIGGALVAVTPFAYSRLFRRPLAEGVIVADSFSIAIALVAVRAIFGPPFWWLSVTASCVGAGLGAGVALRRTRSPLRRSFVPRHLVAVAVSIAALLVVGWTLIRDRPTLEDLWSALEPLEMHSAGDFPPCASASAPECRLDHACATSRSEVYQCPYFIGARQCLLVRADTEVHWGGDNASTEYSCPSLIARHPHDDATIVVSRNVPREWDLMKSNGDVPTRPALLNGARIGFPATPFAVGATAPPIAWSLTAGAGMVAVALFGARFARRARATDERPNLAPYRESARTIEPGDGADVPLWRWAWLVVVSATAPYLIAVVVSLVLSVASRLR